MGIKTQWGDSQIAPTCVMCPEVQLINKISAYNKSLLTKACFLDGSFCYFSFRKTQLWRFKLQSESQNRKTFDQYVYKGVSKVFCSDLLFKEWYLKTYIKLQTKTSMWSNLYKSIALLLRLCPEMRLVFTL